jgi:outer membrane immunogenic protein
MKKSISAFALALALAAGSAQAADLPSRKGPPPAYLPPPPVFTWTGFYVGLNLGGAWRERNYYNDYSWLLFAPVLPVGFGFGNNNNSSNGGVVGGGQIGYNYQFSPWLVVGLETDFQGTSIGSGGGNNNWWGGWGGGGNRERIQWFGTVRGRLGITPFDPHFLIYGTGGFAYGEVSRNTWWNNYSATQTGWTAGGGVEWAFLPNWSAKVEYLYTDLSGNNNNGWNWGIGLNNVNNHTRFHTVRAGVNYHFNLFNPSPVVAKY